MTRRRKLFVALGAVLAIVAALLLWRRQNEVRTATPKPAAATPAVVAAPRTAAPTTTISQKAPPAPRLPSAEAQPAAGVAASAAAPAPALPEAPDAAAPVAPASSTPTPAAKPETPAPVSSEVLATRRMVAAHAPLRAPEEANPDSATNRRILETMVQKALLRADQKSAPATTSAK